MYRETRHLLISNLPDNVKCEEQVKDLFQRHGRVQSMKIITSETEIDDLLINNSISVGNSSTRRPSSLATVSFIDIRSASKALRSVNSFGGQPLIINYYEPNRHKQVEDQDAFESARETPPSASSVINNNNNSSNRRSFIGQGGNSSEEIQSSTNSSHFYHHHQEQCNSNNSSGNKSFLRRGSEPHQHPSSGGGFPPRSSSIGGGGGVGGHHHHNQRRHVYRPQHSFSDRSYVSSVQSAHPHSQPPSQQQQQQQSSSRNWNNFQQQQQSVVVGSGELISERRYAPPSNSSDLEGTSGSLDLQSSGKYNNNNSSSSNSNINKLQRPESPSSGVSSRQHNSSSSRIHLKHIKSNRRRSRSMTDSGASSDDDSPARTSHISHEESRGGGGGGEGGGGSSDEENSRSGSSMSTSMSSSRSRSPAPNSSHSSRHRHYQQQQNQQNYFQSSSGQTPYTSSRTSNQNTFSNQTQQNSYSSSPNSQRPQRYNSRSRDGGGSSRSTPPETPGSGGGGGGGGSVSGHHHRSRLHFRQRIGRGGGGGGGTGENRHRLQQQQQQQQSTQQQRSRAPSPIPQPYSGASSSSSSPSTSTSSSPSPQRNSSSKIGDRIHSPSNSPSSTKSFSPTRSIPLPPQQSSQSGRRSHHRHHHHSHHRRPSSNTMTPAEIQSSIKIYHLPQRSSDTSLKDGLYHEYKKLGKVSWVRVIGSSTERYAIVCFKSSEQAIRAVSMSQDKQFFGCKIRVVPYVKIGGVVGGNINESSGQIFGANSSGGGGGGSSIEDFESGVRLLDISEENFSSVGIPSRSVLITGLEATITQSELRSVFDQYGEILHIDIRRQQTSAAAATQLNYQTYCACIEFMDITSASRAQWSRPPCLGKSSSNVKISFYKSPATNTLLLEGTSGLSDKQITNQCCQYGTNKVVMDRGGVLALVQFDEISSAQMAFRDLRNWVINKRTIHLDYSSLECSRKILERVSGDVMSPTSSSSSMSRSQINSGLNNTPIAGGRNRNRAHNNNIGRFPSSPSYEETKSLTYRNSYRGDPDDAGASSPIINTKQSGGGAPIPIVSSERSIRHSTKQLFLDDEDESCDEEMVVNPNHTAKFGGNYRRMAGSFSAGSGVGGVGDVVVASASMMDHGHPTSKLHCKAPGVGSGAREFPLQQLEEEQKKKLFDLSCHETDSAIVTSSSDVIPGSNLDEETPCESDEQEKEKQKVKQHHLHLHKQLSFTTKLGRKEDSALSIETAKTHSSSKQFLLQQQQIQGHVVDTCVCVSSTSPEPSENTKSDGNMEGDSSSAVLEQPSTSISEDKNNNKEVMNEGSLSNLKIRRSSADSFNTNTNLLGKVPETTSTTTTSAIPEQKSLSADESQEDEEEEEEEENEVEVENEEEDLEEERPGTPCCDENPPEDEEEVKVEPISSIIPLSSSNNSQSKDKSLIVTKKSDGETSPVVVGPLIVENTSSASIIESKPEENKVIDKNSEISEISKEGAVAIIQQQEKIDQDVVEIIPDKKKDKKVELVELIDEEDNNKSPVPSTSAAAAALSLISATTTTKTPISNKKETTNEKESPEITILTQLGPVLTTSTKPSVDPEDIASPASNASSEDRLSPKNLEDPLLDEQIKNFYVRYDQWNTRGGGGGRSFSTGDDPCSVSNNKFLSRHKLLDLDELRQQPSGIFQSVMAKRSVFDEDSKRLENFSEKYEVTAATAPNWRMPFARSFSMSGSGLPSSPSSSSFVSPSLGGMGTSDGGGISAMIKQPPLTPSASLFLHQRSPTTSSILLHHHHHSLNLIRHLVPSPGSNGGSTSSNNVIVVKPQTSPKLPPPPSPSAASTSSTSSSNSSTSSHHQINSPSLNKPHPPPSSLAAATQKPLLPASTSLNVPPPPSPMLLRNLSEPSISSHHHHHPHQKISSERSVSLDSKSNSKVAAEDQNKLPAVPIPTIPLSRRISIESPPQMPSTTTTTTATIPPGVSKQPTLSSIKEKEALQKNTKEKEPPQSSSSSTSATVPVASSMTPIVKKPPTNQLQVIPKKESSVVDESHDKHHHHHKSSKTHKDNKEKDSSSLKKNKDHKEKEHKVTPPSSSSSSDNPPPASTIKKEKETSPVTNITDNPNNKEKDKTDKSVPATADSSNSSNNEKLDSDDKEKIIENKSSSLIAEESSSLQKSGGGKKNDGENNKKSFHSLEHKKDKEKQSESSSSSSKHKNKEKDKEKDSDQGHNKIKHEKHHQHEKLEKSSSTTAPGDSNNSVPKQGRHHSTSTSEEVISSVSISKQIKQETSSSQEKEKKASTPSEGHHGEKGEKAGKLKSSSRRSSSTSSGAKIDSTVKDKEISSNGKEKEKDKDNNKEKSKKKDKEKDKSSTSTGEKGEGHHHHYHSKKRRRPTAESPSSNSNVVVDGSSILGGEPGQKKLKLEIEQESKIRRESRDSTSTSSSSKTTTTTKPESSSKSERISSTSSSSGKHHHHSSSSSIKNKDKENKEKSHDKEKEKKESSSSHKSSGSSGEKKKKSSSSSQEKEEKQHKSSSTSSNKPSHSSISNEEDLLGLQPKKKHVTIKTSGEGVIGEKKRNKEDKDKSKKSSSNSTSSSGEKEREKQKKKKKRKRVIEEDTNSDDSDDSDNESKKKHHSIFEVVVDDYVSMYDKVKARSNRACKMVQPPIPQDMKKRGEDGLIHIKKSRVKRDEKKRSNSTEGQSNKSFNSSADSSSDEDNKKPSSTLSLAQMTLSVSVSDDNRDGDLEIDEDEDEGMRQRSISSSQKHKKDKSQKHSSSASSSLKISSSSTSTIKAGKRSRRRSSSSSKSSHNTHMKHLFIDTEEDESPSGIEPSSSSSLMKQKTNKSTTISKKIKSSDDEKDVGGDSDNVGDILRQKQKSSKLLLKQKKKKKNKTLRNSTTTSSTPIIEEDSNNNNNSSDVSESSDDDEKILSSHRSKSNKHSSSKHFSSASSSSNKKGLRKSSSSSQQPQVQVGTASSKISTGMTGQKIKKTKHGKKAILSLFGSSSSSSSSSSTEDSDADSTSDDDEIISNKTVKVAPPQAKKLSSSKSSRNSSVSSSVAPSIPSVAVGLGTKRKKSSLESPTSSSSISSKKKKRQKQESQHSTPISSMKKDTMQDLLFGPMSSSNSEDETKHNNNDRPPTPDKKKCIYEEKPPTPEPITISTSTPATIEKHSSKKRKSSELKSSSTSEFTIETPSTSSTTTATVAAANETPVLGKSSSTSSSSGKKKKHHHHHHHHHKRSKRSSQDSSSRDTSHHHTTNTTPSEKSISSETKEKSNKGKEKDKENKTKFDEKDYSSIFSTPLGSPLGSLKTERDIETKPDTPEIHNKDNIQQHHHLHQDDILTPVNFMSSVTVKSEDDLKGKSMFSSDEDDNNEINTKLKIDEIIDNDIANDDSDNWPIGKTPKSPGRIFDTEPPTSSSSTNNIMVAEANNENDKEEDAVAKSLHSLFEQNKAIESIMEIRSKSPVNIIPPITTPKNIVGGDTDSIKDELITSKDESTISQEETEDAVAALLVTLGDDSEPGGTVGLDDHHIIPPIVKKISSPPTLRIIEDEEVAIAIEEKPIWMQEEEEAASKNLELELQKDTNDDDDDDDERRLSIDEGPPKTPDIVRSNSTDEKEVEEMSRLREEMREVAEKEKEKELAAAERERIIIPTLLLPEIKKEAAEKGPVPSLPPPPPPPSVTISKDIYEFQDEEDEDKKKKKMEVPQILIPSELSQSIKIESTLETVLHGISPASTTTTPGPAIVSTIIKDSSPSRISPVQQLPPPPPMVQNIINPPPTQEIDNTSSIINSRTPVVVPLPTIQQKKVFIRSHIDDVIENVVRNSHELITTTTQLQQHLLETLPPPPPMTIKPVLPAEISRPNLRSRSRSKSIETEISPPPPPPSYKSPQIPTISEEILKSQSNVVPIITVPVTKPPTTTMTAIVPTSIVAGEDLPNPIILRPLPTPITPSLTTAEKISAVAAAVATSSSVVIPTSSSPTTANILQQQQQQPSRIIKTERRPSIPISHGMSSDNLMESKIGLIMGASSSGEPSPYSSARPPLSSLNTPITTTPTIMTSLASEQYSHHHQLQHSIPTISQMTLKTRTAEIISTPSPSSGITLSNKEGLPAMLAGQHPYHHSSLVSSNYQSLMNKQQQQRPPSPSKLPTTRTILVASSSPVISGLNKPPLISSSPAQLVPLNYPSPQLINQQPPRPILQQQQQMASSPQQQQQQQLRGPHNPMQLRLPQIPSATTITKVTTTTDNAFSGLAERKSIIHGGVIQNSPAAAAVGLTPNVSLTVNPPPSSIVRSGLVPPPSSISKQNLQQHQVQIQTQIQQQVPISATSDDSIHSRINRPQSTITFSSGGLKDQMHGQIQPPRIEIATSNVLIASTQHNSPIAGRVPQSLQIEEQQRRHSPGVQDSRLAYDPNSGEMRMITTPLRYSQQQQQSGSISAGLPNEYVIRRSISSQSPLVSHNIPPPPPGQLQQHHNQVYQSQQTQFNPTTTSISSPIPGGPASNYLPLRSIGANKSYISENTNPIPAHIHHHVVSTPPPSGPVLVPELLRTGGVGGGSDSPMVANYAGSRHIYPSGSSTPATPPVAHQAQTQFQRQTFTNPYADIRLSDLPERVVVASSRSYSPSPQTQWSSYETPVPVTSRASANSSPFNNIQMLSLVRSGSRSGMPPSPPPAHHGISRYGPIPAAEAPIERQLHSPSHIGSVPQGDSLLMLLQRYPIMWQGLLGLKNDNAACQMHFVSGNVNVARESLPLNPDGTVPPLRISQRMRLEQTQLEGVARKMQMEAEHCILLALPCGRDHYDVLQQSNNLRNGFITYLQLKQAAGIVNTFDPNSQAVTPAHVIHIFPSCDFANENLARIAPDLLHGVADIAHLLIVIATV